MESDQDLGPKPVTRFRRRCQWVTYVLRELASVVLAGYSIFLMVVLIRQGQGQDAFRDFFRGVLQAPLSLVLHLIVLAFALVQSAASFHAVGKAMADGREGKRVSPILITEIGYGIWIIVSVLIFIGVITWSQAFEMSG